MRSIALYLAVAFAVFDIALAHAELVTLDLATGLKSDGELVTASNGYDGYLDAYWRTPAGDSQAVPILLSTGSDWDPAYVSNGPNSDWINANGQPFRLIDDFFWLSRNIDETGFDEASITLTGTWAVDGTASLFAADDLVNPIATISPGNSGHMTPFSIPQGTFHGNGGLNTYGLLILGNYRAARLEGVMSGDFIGPGGPTGVPEPSAWIFSVAPIALLVLRRVRVGHSRSAIR